MFTSREFAERDTLAYKLQRHVTGSQDRIDVGHYVSEPMKDKKLKSEYKSTIERANRTVDARIAREEKERRALMIIDEDDDDEDDVDQDDEDNDADAEDWRTLFVKKILARREEQKNQGPLMFSFEPQRLHLEDYGLRVHASDFALPEDVERSTKASLSSERYGLGSRKLIGTRTESTNTTTDEALKHIQVFDDDESARHQKLEIEQDPTTSRYVSKPLLVVCQIGFVNMEGRSDGESMRATIENLAPRRVVFVRGNPEENSKMKSFAENRLCRHGGCESIGFPILVLKFNSKPRLHRLRSLWINRWSVTCPCVLLGSMRSVRFVVFFIMMLQLLQRNVSVQQRPHHQRRRIRN